MKKARQIKNSAGKKRAKKGNWEPRADQSARILKNRERKRDRQGINVSECACQYVCRYACKRCVNKERRKRISAAVWHSSGLDRAGLLCKDNVIMILCLVIKPKSDCVCTHNHTHTHIDNNRERGCRNRKPRRWQPVF